MILKYPILWMRDYKCYFVLLVSISLRFRKPDVITVRGLHAGRRMCPGITFGVANVELALANLLFHFDWKMPNGEKPEDLDMDESFGLSVKKKNDLKLIPVKYSSSAI